MRKGRYNVQLPQSYGHVIMKFNVYMNDACRYFIYFEGEYIPIVKKERYKGGWLWKFMDFSKEVKNGNI